MDEKKRKRRQKENKRESARHLQSPENASDHMRKRNRTKGNTITNIQPETLKRNITSDGPTQAHKTLTRGGIDACQQREKKHTNWHQYSQKKPVLLHVCLLSSVKGHGLPKTKSEKKNTANLRRNPAAANAIKMSGQKGIQSSIFSIVSIMLHHFPRRAHWHKPQLRQKKYFSAEDI